jgi:hypothetical protein
MLIDVLIKNSWLAAIVWGVLSLSDHALTRFSAKLHQSLSQERQTITRQGGLELNPVFEQEVKRLQWFSPRFIIMFVLAFSLILLLGLIISKPAFEILIGAFILEWIVIDLVHFQNLLTFRDMKNPRSATGHIELSYWLSQRTSAYHLLSFALLYLILAIATFRLFFVGGTISCSFLALRQFSLANRIFTPSTNSKTDSTNSSKS